MVLGAEAAEARSALLESATVPGWPPSLAAAYAACRQLARSHYENFPVASGMLPAAMRPHIAALYAFARIADDFADEGTLAADERRAKLNRWRDRLHEAVESPALPRTGDRDELILSAVGHSIRSFELPIALFDDLISAFTQDTVTTRYGSWCELLDYCRRSANPVGRLVLRIAGYRDPQLDRSSDALCTALQLTNFWQDFGRDWRSGRIYVPAEVSGATGASERELHEGRMTDGWARALEASVAFTRPFFAQGRSVCDGVRGRLRLELRFTWLGGMRILERAARGRFDALERRPSLGIQDAPVLLWRAVRWPPQAVRSARPSSDLVR
jgi:phytoene synthase